MTRPSTPPILTELRSPSSPTRQIEALRSLKNEIIGHEQKKEMWVGLGVVTHIERILSTYRGASGSKRRHQEDSGGTEAYFQDTQKQDDQEARLQAVITVGSLAHGGPAYIAPLQAGQIFPALLSILTPTESSSSLVLAALRALNTIADSVLLEHPKNNTSEDGFLKTLYMDRYLTSLTHILEQESPSLVVQQQICLAASLISKTCRQESHRKQLTLFGVLDALATRLASFVVASSTTSKSRTATGGSNRPPILPATSRARLAPVLQAIGTIITDSSVRASKFMCASAFAAIFPYSDPYSWRVPLGKKQRAKTIENNLPPLSSLATLGKRSGKGYSSALETTPTEAFGSSKDEEIPLVAWLIEVVRAQTGLVRLMSAWIVAILYRFGLASQRKENSLSMLLVPVLVQMLDSNHTSVVDENSSYDMSLLHIPTWLTLQNAPHVLALLVAESPDLQKAASDAGVIKKLSQLLKQSYDPIPASSTAMMWSPTETGRSEIPSREPASVSKLGPPGLQPILLHTLQVRKAVLMALHAMATFKDDYRKAIIDNGVVPFIVESLKPYDKSVEMDTLVIEKSRNEFHKLGNPTSVLIAACAAAKSLSRSVGALRTILVDANLADPIYKLLTNPDVEVQVAATSAACNIVLEFSAMRETFIEAGILKILCEHAHSLNAKLRLNAVWALKHLVLSAPNSLKISCVQELGPGWLKQIICNDTDDHFSHRVGSDRGGTPIAMGTPNAAGEQVDLLNAMDEGPQLLSSNQEVDDDDEVNMIDSVGPLSQSDPRNKQSRFANQENKQASLERQKLADLYDDEAQVAAQARRDDLAVQEQGLALIRNLICGPESPDMVDYLFKEFGQDRFFDMLGKLLRPKVVDAFNRDRRLIRTGVKHVQPPNEIVIAVCFILVHLAGSQSRHRQLLISQSELLKLMVPLFNHPNPEVRVCCVWTVINLTWTDDHSDKSHCKARAFELRKLGVLDKLHELESDTELDVRERTKMAMVQMNDLLR